MKNPNARSILAIFMIALVSPIVWFRAYPFVAGGDYSPNLLPTMNLYKYFHVWHEERLGSSAFQYTALIPFAISLAVANFFGFPEALLERLTFYFLFSCSGISMYLLSSTVLRKKGNTTAFLSALLYMFNPWALVLIWSSSIMSLGFFFAYAFFPLTFAVVAKGLKEKRGLGYIAQICPVVLASIPSYSNPVVAVLQWSLIIAYLIFYVVVEKGDVKQAFKFVSIFAAIWLLLNTFWILPLLPKTSYYAFPQDIWIAHNIDVFRAAGAPMLDVIRLTGYWTLKEYVLDDPFIPWAPIYSSVPFVLLSFLLPFLAFMPLLFKPKEKSVFFFALLTIVSLFFMKGAYPPAGEWVVSFFIRSGLLMTLFRNSYHKFGLFAALGFSFLVAYAIGEIHTCLSNITARLPSSSRKIGMRGLKIAAPSLCVFLLAGIYVWPFWTGDVVNSGSNVIASGRVRIPDYYFEAARWINSQQDDFYIFSLPVSKTLPTVHYWWNNGTEGYSGVDPAYALFSKPLISNALDAYNFAGRIAELMVSNRTSNLGELLSLLNVKYILLHKDVDAVFTKSYTITPQSGDLNTILDHAPDLSLERQFDELIFYRNLKWRYSLVNVKSNVITVEGSVSELFDFIIYSVGRLNLTSTLFLSSEQLEQIQIPLILDYNNTVVSLTIANLTAYDGYESPISWSSLENGTLVARYYSGWKQVIRTVVVEGEEDTLSFRSLQECPYNFPEFSPGGWTAYDSTLVFLRTASEPFMISRVEVDELSPARIVGVWWETGWMGMSTKTISYPIVIPPHEKAIMQLEGKVDSIKLGYFEQLDLLNIAENAEVLSIVPKKADPTRYVIQINTTSPFFIKLTQQFYEGWIASIGDVKVPEEYHFVANGFGNAWFIKKTGIHTIILEYEPQRLFHVGSIISLATFIFFAILFALNICLPRIFKEPIEK